VKRPLAILLLASIFLHTGGFYVYFVLRMNHIHQQKRAHLRTLPADQLVVLTLSPEKLQAARVGDDELKVDGRMFDIARIYAEGRQVKVWGLYDEDEDDLLTLCDGILKRASADQPPPASLTNYLVLIFVHSPVLALAATSVSNTLPVGQPTDFFSSPTLALQTPPPRATAQASP